MGNAIQIVVDVLLIVMTAGLVLVLLALARELGRVQIRLGPLSRQLESVTPTKLHFVGPSFAELRDHLDRPTTIGGTRERPQLVLFTSPTCSSCQALLPAVLTVASLTDEVEIVLISDANDAAHATYLSHNQIGSAVRYLNAREVGLAYQVSITPYGVVLDCEGIVRGSARCRDFTEVQALMQSVGLTLPEISLPLLASGATHHSPTAERTTT